MSLIPHNRLNYSPKPKSDKPPGPLTRAIDLCIEQIDRAQRADAKLTALRDEEGRSDAFREKCDAALAECQRLANTASDTITSLSGMVELAVDLAADVKEIVQEAGL